MKSHKKSLIKTLKAHLVITHFQILKKVGVLAVEMTRITQLLVEALNMNSKKTSGEAPKLAELFDLILCEQAR